MNKTLKNLMLVGALSTIPAVFSSATAAEKIVSAGASVTELIYALDAQSKLVGVDVTSVTPEGTTIPKVGYHRALSAEGLLALEPTLVIGSDEMGPKPALDQLSRVGVDVEVVDTSSTIEGLNHRIDQIAKLTNSEAKVGELKEKVAQQVEALNSNQPSQSNMKKVLFLLIHEGRPANVAGNGTTPDAIIKLAGGINPAASQIDSYKPLSNEAMVEMQPDVILVSGRSYEKMGGSDAVLKALPLLAATPAGKNGDIVTIDGHALVGGLGLKSLAEAKRINELLYP
ncbi:MULTISPECIES: ABC transporter substrate-binding protein [Vibrio]|uniref:Hemin ABC transporter substrate-binding protein n=1 Tax=Vibrio mediterranei TaxID=689 RepID=A0A2S9ZR96_9VIBR|nr:MULTISPECIES: ABC transporter substrate-binding protein [Vibrio]AYV23277.1 hemin ABC transporter substrate-binding protein [Vibrio mediterranei]KFA98162.1 hemin receptor [Vibrio sp. ER1A]MCF4174961.1 ABC transporter substrate-binding protein [Vibrio sp. McD22-P3]MDA0107135.1 ABC transporter substrate-binding protein [Vibrio sp. La 4.2.2]NOH28926.1 ABC transporter substrate-binding protein [Vibrio mediterranei]